MTHLNPCQHTGALRWAQHLFVDLQPADRVDQVGFGCCPAGVTVSRVTLSVSFVRGGLGQG